MTTPLDGATGSDVPAAITRTTAALGDFLAEKNRRYGNSALAPVRVFSRATPDEGMRIRMDDKLSRIRNGTGELRKNDVADLLGYLVLLCVHRGWTDFGDLLD